MNKNSLVDIARNLRDHYAVKTKNKHIKDVKSFYSSPAYLSYWHVFMQVIIPTKIPHCFIFYEPFYGFCRTRVQELRLPSYQYPPHNKFY